MRTNKSLLLSVAIVLLTKILVDSGFTSNFYQETIVTDETGIDMVFVPAGRFTMGIQIDEISDFCENLYGTDIGNCDISTLAEDLSTDPSGETTFGTVNLSAFYIDRYEVSIEAYIQCVEADVCQINPVEQTIQALRRDISIDTSLPVSSVTFFDAAVYCAWRGGRLPTEAEWEYAARGNQSAFFPWGATIENIPANYCTECETDSLFAISDGFPNLAPVTSFQDGRSWVGAYNMAGNVREWTRGMAPGGNFQILKGGGYQSYVIDLATWVRVPRIPSLVVASEDVGFRCRRSAE